MSVQTWDVSSAVESSIRHREGQTEPHTPWWAAALLFGTWNKQPFPCALNYDASSGYPKVLLLFSDFIRLLVRYDCRMPLLFQEYMVISSVMVIRPANHETGNSRSEAAALHRSFADRRDVGAALAQSRDTHRESQPPGTILIKKGGFSALSCTRHTRPLRPPRVPGSVTGVSQECGEGTSGFLGKHSQSGAFGEWAAMT